MKWGAITSKRRDNVKHPPLRTFSELCEELGVTRHQMIHLFNRHSLKRPKPALSHIRNDTVRNQWYEPVQFRQWFADIPQQYKDKT